MSWVSDPEIWIGFLTLVALEIVLGIDNLVFLSILSGKLPGAAQQARARRIGLVLALVMRVLLLLTLSWIIGLVAPLFTMFGHEISARDLILIAGGLFLLAKSTYEIHDRLEGETGHASAAVKASFVSVIIQIGLLDMVFSLDSVITAVGMVEQVGVMIAAVIVAVAVMIVSSTTIARFVERHPTIKMLALSFLLMIGMALVLDGLEIHIPKGYIYFAMAFSLGVELLNLRVRAKQAPVDLHQRYSSRSS